MARRGPGRPPKRKAPKYRLGKASSLPGDLWFRWLGHVLKVGPTWLYVALLLSHLLCLRITEVLRLQGKDFDLRNGACQVKPLKRRSAMTKHVLTSIRPMLQNLKSKGVKRKRTKAQGARGKIHFQDVWKWPTEGKNFLFPSDRADAWDSHRNKDTACKAVSRLRASFNPGAGQCLNTALIRTHSGRHRMINDCKSSGLPDDVAMHFARIVDKRTHVGC